MSAGAGQDAGQHYGALLHSTFLAVDVTLGAYKEMLAVI